MITYPLDGLYRVGMSSLVYHISYGVGSALLVLRSDGYARCLETAGRVTVRILRFFVELINPSDWGSKDIFSKASEINVLHRVQNIRL